MALPKWNSEWEKPDPLRGAQGWSGHHFAAVGTAVVLVLLAIAWVSPAVTKARFRERDMNRACKQLMEALAGASVGAATSPSLKKQPSGEATTVKDGGPQTFTDPKNRFSVTLPSTPELKPQSGVAANGLTELAIWEVRDGDTTYFLSAIYAPAEFLDATFNLDQLVGRGDNPHWRIVTRREITIDGQPGKLVEFASDGRMRASVSVFTRYQGTVVALSVIGASGLTSESKETRAFFESFRFTREGAPVGK
jgi:hypothetical protein